MTTDARPRIHRRVQIRLLIAVVAGLAAALLVPTPANAPLELSTLIGYAVASLVFCVPLLWTMFHYDNERTQHTMTGFEQTRTEIDVIVIGSALASLGAVGVMLLGGAKQGTSSANIEAAVAVLAIASGWLTVHTMWTLRYAKHYYSVEPGCIDFNTKDAPALSDFAYLAFTLGMTYQVSDTNLSTPKIRRLVLEHTLLSYVFGTVIVASTINLVVNLAG